MAGTVDVESQKRIKALRKKLSQIEKLKEKEADTLTPEEAAKIEGEAKILSEIVAIERGEAMPRAVVQEAPAPAVEKEAPALAPAVPAAAAEAAPAAAAAPEEGAAPEEDRRGVVHLASLPAHMRADKVRHLMEQFGEIGRVYLAPEDKADHQRRRRSGGNRKAKFSEGWVEFAERRLAKRVALTLNGTTIGGRKRHNYYRDDMWNIRYLPRFKWHQLKEGSIYNRQVRKARLQQRISQARRENDFYLERVEQAKLRQRVEERQARKAAAGRPAAAATAAAKAAVAADGAGRPEAARSTALPGRGGPAVRRRAPPGPGGGEEPADAAPISSRVLNSLI
mmetsp:Transcript_29548/g.78995  ORF Transcript_29548/g.78995 Transcript_29548/m.78995 type:complete len:338 (+) Transcript_29548:66-1079(+)